MITPSAQDELRCASNTVEDKIASAVKGMPIESAVATLGHILRHINRRVEYEGQILFDDIVALRKLLPDVATCLKSLRDVAGAQQQASAIDAALKASYCDANTYRSLAIISAEAGALRECVYGALKVLQPIAATHRDKTDYRGIRDTIRKYVIWQIDQERQLIQPAFYGRGPRR